MRLSIGLAVGSFAALAFVFACTNDTSSGGGGAFTTDAGSFDASASPPPPPAPPPPPPTPPPPPPAAQCPIADSATFTATMKLTTDDNYKVYVNGTLVDDVARVWSDPQTYSITLFRNPTRKNVIAVEGINTAKIDGLDRGVLVDIAYTEASVPRSIVSDTSWKISSTMVASWFDVAFDDSAWTAAVDEGAHGIAPWGMVFGTSDAHWLWAFDSSGAASAKADVESVWLRKTFYVDLAGAPTSTPNACP
jgi:hypothetical protein